MRSFVFGLLCGVFIAAIATVIALQLLGESATNSGAATKIAPTVVPVESRTTSAADAAELARKLEGANDTVLAQTLETAQFERTWAGVKAVSDALRARAPKVDPLTGLAESAVIGPRAKPVPLLALEQEVARRRLVLDLRTRDNAATRLLDTANEDDSVKKLVELFTADARPAEYERVREDAALVLAFGATAQGREVLARAIHEPTNHGRAVIAARALGLSDDEKAFALLGDVLANDREPEVRKLGAYGLGFSSALARGSADAVAALARAVKQDVETGVRVAAAAALGSADLARAPAARATLVETIASPSDPEPVRFEAIAAIQHARHETKWTPPDVIEGLFQALNTEHDGPIRIMIATTLGECAPPARSVDLETALVSAQDPRVREALAKAIAAVKARGEPPP